MLCLYFFSHKSADVLKFFLGQVEKVFLARELVCVHAQLAQDQLIESQQLLDNRQLAQVKTCAVHLFGKIAGESDDPVEVRVLHILRVNDKV